MVFYIHSKKLVKTRASIKFLDYLKDTRFFLNSYSKNQEQLKTKKTQKDHIGKKNRWVH